MQTKCGRRLASWLETVSKIENEAHFLVSSGRAGQATCDKSDCQWHLLWKIGLITIDQVF